MTNFASPWTQSKLPSKLGEWRHITAPRNSLRDSLWTQANHGRARDTAFPTKTKAMQHSPSSSPRASASGTWARSPAAYDRAFQVTIAMPFGGRSSRNLSPRISPLHFRGPSLAIWRGVGTEPHHGNAIAAITLVSLQVNASASHLQREDPNRKWVWHSYLSLHSAHVRGPPNDPPWIKEPSHTTAAVQIDATRNNQGCCSTSTA